MQREALYREIARELRGGLVRETMVGGKLPADGDLARRFGVSMRTVREALLILEADGLVERQHGRGTVVRRRLAPVGLFSELNLLHPATARAWGLVLDIVRARLAEQGYQTRLYTGRSQASDGPGRFSCPELLEDGLAGRLGGVVTVTARPTGTPMSRLREAGLPMACVSGGDWLNEVFGPHHQPAVAVPYLAGLGRRRLGLIGWDPPESTGTGRLVGAFGAAVTATGLRFVPQWCRVDLSFGARGAGWEEFREIWFATDTKPDALVITNENYLPEVIMAVLQLGIRVPEDLTIVCHQTRHVDMQAPVPIAWVEQDVDTFAALLAERALAALAGEPAPRPPTDVAPYRLLPLAGRAAAKAEVATAARSAATPSKRSTRA